MKALDIQNLKKTYANEHVALEGIDLVVEQGDFFALLGPNGAGKSTTIGVITSLVTKSAGTVRVFDHDIDHELDAAKACHGVVPQEFNFSPFENSLNIVVNQAGYYGLQKKRAEEKAEYYLQQLGLWEKRKQPSRNLSGGMKRRLMIARALVHEPRMLILDEPTAGVDVELRRTMWDYLIELNNKGTTILLTTHYLEEAETLCRNIAIIDHGKIIENTAMKTLLGKLDKQTFVLDLKEPVSYFGDIDNFSIKQIDNMTLEVEIHKKQLINDLFNLLQEKGYQVCSMRNKTNRLEELFMDLLKEDNS